MRRPTVYIVAGPNGAGKTTFVTEFLPNFARCQEFLNADMIAHGLSPFAPEAQNLRAGFLFMERFNDLVKKKKDFGFETTLSGRTYVKTLNEMKSVGFRIALFFLWLPGETMAIQRVANRVKEGGHAVPEADIRRRYWSGLRNLFQLYRSLADEWRVFDASFLPPRLIVSEIDGKLKVFDAELFTRLEQQAGGKSNAQA